VFIATFAPILTPIFDMILANTIGISIATSFAVASVILPATLAIITDTFDIVGTVVAHIFFAIIAPRPTIFT
jgi:hypothetical protein